MDNILSYTSDSESDDNNGNSDKKEAVSSNRNIDTNSQKTVESGSSSNPNTQKHINPTTITTNPSVEIQSSVTNFFNLNSSLDIGSPFTKTSSGVERCLTTPFGSVEIPEGDFWKSFNPDVKDVSCFQNEKIKPIESVYKYNEHERKRSSQSNHSFSTISHSKSKHSRISSSDNDIHVSTRHLHSDSKVATTNCPTNKEHITQSQGCTSDQKRKMFYVHSKVMPYLHSMTSCKLCCRVSKTWKAHPTVINRINWNTSNYSHLLLSAGNCQYNYCFITIMAGKESQTI